MKSYAGPVDRASRAPVAQAQPRPLVIAHRGASGLAPENTSLAVETAIAAGADMVEVDLRLSRDGHLVVVHDRAIGRTARFPPHAIKRIPRRRGGLVRFADLTMEEINSLDAGSWRGPEFAGLGVPTLSDLLSLCAGRIALNLELKPDAGSGVKQDKARRPMVEHLAHALSADPAPDSILISSMDVAVLDLVRARLPAARIGVLVTRRAWLMAGGSAKALRAADRLDAFSLHIPCALARPRLIASAHRRRLRLFAYTANGPTPLRRLIAAGVDGIFTDYPERLLALLQRAREPARRL